MRPSDAHLHAHAHMHGQLQILPAAAARPNPPFKIAAAGSPDEACGGLQPLSRASAPLPAACAAAATKMGPDLLLPAELWVEIFNFLFLDVSCACAATEGAAPSLHTTLSAVATLLRCESVCTTVSFQRTRARILVGAWVLPHPAAHAAAVRVASLAMGPGHVHVHSCLPLEPCRPDQWLQGAKASHWWVVLASLSGPPTTHNH